MKLVEYRTVNGVVPCRGHSKPVAGRGWHFRRYWWYLLGGIHRGIRWKDKKRLSVANLLQYR